MISKTGRQVQEDAQPHTRLKRNLQDLYGSGQVPGERLQSVLDDVAECEEQGYVSGFTELRSTGGGKNMARDLRRRMLRRSVWPNLYQAQITIYDPKLDQEARHWNGKLLWQFFGNFGISLVIPILGVGLGCLGACEKIFSVHRGVSKSL